MAQRITVRMSRWQRALDALLRTGRPSARRRHPAPDLTEFRESGYRDSGYRYSEALDPEYRDSDDRNAYSRPRPDLLQSLGGRVD